jgi:hypothetical protein
VADPLDLTGDIAAAVNGAAGRGHALALSYIDDDGYPTVSFRGSTQVHGPETLAVWARKADEGFARAIAARPQVGLVYYGPGGPGPMFLRFRGRAHVDPSANDAVYAGMIEGERQQDPRRAGVAVIIDVERVEGFGADGPFVQERAPRS